MKKTAVRDFYENSVLKEWRRLARDPFHGLEFNTTLHFLKKYLPQKGLILDAGGGPGRYTIELAKQGYKVVLLDLSPHLLKIAKKQISKAGVGHKVKSIIEGSITDLSQFADSHFDAVLCLGGPLSHVEGESNRKQAVSELVRVAKKNLPIFISVMGRLAVVMEAARYWPEEIEMTSHFKELWKNGEDNLWCGSSYCHFFLPDELKKIVEKGGAEIVEGVGLEGLGSHFRKEINRLARNRPVAWKNWLESHYRLCTHPAVFATSGHMLVVGKKK